MNRDFYNSELQRSPTPSGTLRTCVCMLVSMAPHLTDKGTEISQAYVDAGYCLDASDYVANGGWGRGFIHRYPEAAVEHEVYNAELARKVRQHRARKEAAK